MKKKILLALMGIGIAVIPGFAQSSFDTSPDAQTGEKPLGSYFATDIDTVSMTNGNLHLSIPLVNLPGREDCGRAPAASGAWQTTPQVPHHQ